jgi:hypothetical protein
MNLLNLKSGVRSAIFAALTARFAKAFAVGLNFAVKI